MKTFKEFISEKFHDDYPKKKKWYELSPEESDKYAEDFVELIINSYKPVGGYPGMNSAKDLKKEIEKDKLIFYAIDINKDPDADAITFSKKTKHGEKFIGMATNGEPESKKEMLDKRAKEMMKKGMYAEVSDKISEIFINKYKVPTVNDEQLVRDVLAGKEIIWYGKHPSQSDKYPSTATGWYSRKIGGESHIKIMIGHPKE